TPQTIPSQIARTHQIRYILPSSGQNRFPAQDQGSNKMKEKDVVDITPGASYAKFAHEPRIQLNPRHVGFGLAAVVVAILIFSSFFQIGADSVGVVLRLGKFTHQVGPGLHFKLPLGIDRVYKVPTEKQLKEEFGFRTADSSGERAVYAGGNFIDESLMLTGDLNVIDVEWTVQYRI